MPVARSAAPYSLAGGARHDASRLAAIDADTGASISYGELDEGSRRVAALLGSLGLAAGDHVAVMLENTLRYLEVAWAAQRSGLYLTPVNWHLSRDEAAYIVRDCGAKVLFSSRTVGDLAVDVANAAGVEHRISIGESISGFVDLDGALEALDESVEPPDEVEGSIMFYSSGTTGRPKGIMTPLTGETFGARAPMPPDMENAFRMGPDMVYLSPAPLYHSGPLGAVMTAQRMGGVVVVMPRFDAVDTLRVIEQFRVTHAQFVPTMFVRLLKLQDEERARHDVSSLEVVFHSAAPCPVEVKERMIEWWGPKIWEVYGGSEGNGLCLVDSSEWLTHKGTVGRAILGQIHVLDDDGQELGPGSVGTIYFSGASGFEYHNDPLKTAAAYHGDDMSTLGDLGHIDADGYLYLSDRRSDLIISGGVNIYPQEVENLLVLHPRVADVAVIGVPDDDMGQSVKAVVTPIDMSDAGAEFAAELIGYCRDRLAHFKCPRSVDFDPDLPRLPSGKLFKRRLMDRYAAAAADAAKSAEQLTTIQTEK